MEYNNIALDEAFLLARMAKDGKQGPPGPQGPAGPRGPKGAKGDPGSGVSIVERDVTTFEDIVSVINAGNTIIVKDGDYLYIASIWTAPPFPENQNNVLLRCPSINGTEVVTARSYNIDRYTNAWTLYEHVFEKSGEPLRIKQWATNNLDVSIPACTQEIENTSIPKLIFTIDDIEGADYQIAGMMAYEIFDAETGGNRINCWPVCQFTGNNQKELTIRFMCNGTSAKTAKRINAWVLLKHR